MSSKNESVAPISVSSAEELVQQLHDSSPVAYLTQAVFQCVNYTGFQVLAVYESCGRGILSAELKSVVEAVRAQLASSGVPVIVVDVAKLHRSLDPSSYGFNTDQGPATIEHAASKLNEFSGNPAALQKAVAAHPIQTQPKEVVFAAAKRKRSLFSLFKSSDAKPTDGAASVNPAQSTKKSTPGQS